jgi:hypothetical protein
MPLATEDDGKGDEKRRASSAAGPAKVSIRKIDSGCSVGDSLYSRISASRWRQPLNEKSAHAPANKTSAGDAVTDRVGITRQKGRSSSCHGRCST